MLQVELSIVDRIQPQSNKFTTGVFQNYGILCVVLESIVAILQNMSFSHGSERVNFKVEIF